ncbi:hypothetical protein CLOP_g20199 [Closterium sp. NIES-67]|nr:hypothetical protein CLOP_g20199 [Closterium sp. NIES-67]
MGVAKTLTAISTALVVLLSLVLIGTGIWMTTRSGATECVQFLRIPLIVVGSVLCAVALAGFIGAVNDIAWLLFIYLAVVFLAIWVLLGFTVFAFVVTNQGVADAVSNKGIGSWRTTDFSSWLQTLVTEQAKWAPIQACLAAGNTCAVLNQTITSASSTLSAIQAGCCYPPSPAPPHLSPPPPARPSPPTSLLTQSPQLSLPPSTPRICLIWPAIPPATACCTAARRAGCATGARRARRGS